MSEDYISKLQNSLAQLISSGTAKNKVGNIGILVLWKVCEKTVLKIIMNIPGMIPGVMCDLHSQ